MEGWNQREEMNVVLYLVQGGRESVPINTGTAEGLIVPNRAWLGVFGYPEAQNILRSQGLEPETSRR